MKEYVYKKADPVFKGMKKGYAAVFVSDNDNPTNIDRIRIFHCQDLPVYAFYGVNSNKPMNIEYNNPDGIESCGNMIFQPCWANGHKYSTVKRQIKTMTKYDFLYNRNTIFLGYVKEVE